MTVAPRFVRMLLSTSWAHCEAVYKRAGVHTISLSFRSGAATELLRTLTLRWWSMSRLDEWIGIFASWIDLAPSIKRCSAGIGRPVAAVSGVSPGNAMLDCSNIALPTPHITQARTVVAY
jgi:hypothetical protein